MFVSIGLAEDRKQPKQSTPFVFAMLVLVCSAATTALVIQAVYYSPTYDEPAHLFAAIAAEKGDLGHYKVDPPLLKFWDGAILGAMYALPSTPPSTEYRGSSRAEFALSEDLFMRDPVSCNAMLTTARLGRIPIICLGIVLMWMLLIDESLHTRALATILWVTSPLLLGNGWSLSHDSVSAVAMLLVSIFMLRWLRGPTAKNAVLMGLVWGIALSTRFIFLPILIVFPVAASLFASQCDWARLINYLVGYLIQILIAILTVNAAYGFTGSLAPFDLHRFESSGILGSLRELGPIWSPMPRLYLEGLDHQLLHMESDKLAYLAGKLYATKNPFFMVCLYLFKEQLATIAFLLVGSVTSICCVVHGRRWHGLFVSKTFFLVLLATTFLGVVVTGGSSVGHSRYLLPVFPLASCIAATSNSQWLARLKCPAVYCALLTLPCFELAHNFPFFHGYVSPIAGGRHSTPPVFLHGNVDSGQDVYRVRDLIQKTDIVSRYGAEKCFLLGHGVAFQWTRMPVGPPSTEIMAQALRGKRVGRVQAIIVLSRDFVSLADWENSHLSSNYNHSSLGKLASELAHLRPDGFVCETYAVYKVVAIE